MNNARPALTLYAALNYPVLLLVMLLHLRVAPLTTGYSIAFGIAAYLVYGAAYVAFVWLLARMVLAVAQRTLPERAALLAAYAFAVLAFSLLSIGMFIDGQLYALYGFHFNGFVWNLMTTRGGFASMGMSDTARYTGAVFVVVIVFIQAGLAFMVSRFLHSRRERLRGWRPLVRAATMALVVLALAEQTAFGFAHMHGYAPVVLTAKVFPLYQPTTFKSMARTLGYQVPRTRGVRAAFEGMDLNYPVAPLQVNAPAKPLNIVWLVSESWRWDMLDPEIMPRTAAFASESRRFTHHYSGGNGTRMGLFSMFFGLYGNYWFPMLTHRRGPVLMDVLQEQGYQINAFTSANFSYPEFDKTIFAQVPGSAMHEDSNGETWARDRRNVTALLTTLDHRDRSKPFMTFMFFESPHARYEFPPEAAIRTPYLDDLNYATMDLKRDIGLIKNRYINACHHLDSQFARVLDYLEREKLLDSTVVIMTGDHGEEFMEKGRWGHNSDFTEEQVRVPLVLHVPGVAPAQIDEMSSHLDLPATLLPLLGVRNSAADYSLGHDLLDPARKRPYTVFASWTDLAYRDDAYKASFPRESGNVFGVTVHTGQDRPVADADAFYAERSAQIAEMMRNTARFTRRPQGAIQKVAAAEP